MPLSQSESAQPIRDEQGPSGPAPAVPRAGEVGSASREDLAAQLAGTRFRAVQWFETIDSTNRYLVDAAAAGEAPGLVAVADEQRAGRGRLGRTWIAPPGASLLTSLLLADALPAEQRHLVVVAAALAAIDAVDAHCGFRPRLKWPNDLVVDDRKLAGLLAEATGGNGVVVGMGLNVDWNDFPPEIAATATACNLEGKAAPRAELLVAWLRALDARLDALVTHGPSDLAHEHTANSATLGRRVRVERARDSLVGDAVALTALGHLVVRADDGEEHAVTAGDVVHLRPAG
jgi:BirA family transcriptional regulator, biotin operon repressor / biotin---[acetyl-CoA-carboxylase] ligase